MEFEDQEEHDEEMELEPSYESLVNNNSNNNNNSGRVKMATTGGGEAMISAVVALQPQQPRKACRYRECLKNHAVGIGGHALDGCGEFLAAGPEGTLDGLKCAACSCHRNFHRKEADEPYGQIVPHQGGHVGLHHHHPGFGNQQFSPAGFYRTPAGYLHVTTQQRPLALPSTSGGGTDQDDDMSNPSGGGGSGFGMGMGTTSSKKRFRTKFSQEQKERMLELAERLGWKIQKQDEEAVQSFCEQTGVKRHVLKVWMHNNKHTLGKKP